jgi:hypothetical protein
MLSAAMGNKKSHRRSPSRVGLTLLELLAVITILLVLIGLAVALGPRLYQRQKVAAGADLVQQWLLTGKSQAARQRTPCGLRLVPIAGLTASLQPVAAGANRLVTPAAMSGHVGTLPWQIIPGAVLIVHDSDPAGPSLPTNLETVRVLSASATSFQADFQHDHPAGCTIKILAYVKDLWYIEQPVDYVVEPGVSMLPGTDPLPGLNARQLKVDASALNVAILERLPLYPRGGPLPSLRPPSLLPGSAPPAGAQVPGDFTGGYGFAYPDSRPVPNVGAVVDPSTPNLPSLWPVQPGDYLELNGGGLVHRIAAVTYYTWPNDPARPSQPAARRRDPVPGSNPPVLEGNALFLQSPLPHAVELTREYRILRSPRVTAGEFALQLPEGVAIDLIKNALFAGAGAPLLPVDPLTGQIDILFAPRGSVVGRGSADERITFWLRDVTLDPAQPGEQLLITVSTRSGLIGAHPVDPSNNYADPYRFTRDGLSSGL